MNTRSQARKLLPSFVIKMYHYKLALIGAFLYGFPGLSKKIKVIGITGTSGKSTVVDMTTKVLEEAGYKVASLSSVRFKIGEKELENKLKMTMPGRLKIQKFLRQAINENCQYVIIEVTSEGIRQFRHKFINFDASVFTNLSPEHIESHGGFANYRNEKLKLFNATKNIHIINIDDENVEHFLKFPARIKYFYSTKNIKKDSQTVLGEKIENNQSGVSFEVKGVKFNLNILGEFNVYNALSAICVGLAYNVPLLKSQSALEKIKGVPGRMEIIQSSPYRVVVDYAHTPEALEKVYKNLSSTSPLICVLGSCGGGRDKWKRPVLGKIAHRYCKEVIITNEDPYDEDPSKIIDQVASGAENAIKVPGRREAIARAIKNAKSGDTVIITGKGCEPWMSVANGKKIPWDDRKIAKEELDNIQ